MRTNAVSSLPQPIIIHVVKESKNPTILSNIIGYAMVPLTIGACGGVFLYELAKGEIDGHPILGAFITAAVMSVATRILQKSADTIVDATIFAIKLPFKIIAYPFTSESSKADQLAKEIIKSSN